jgi:hypothetical protein
MSMIGNYLRVSEQQLEDLQAEPSQIHEIIHPSDASRRAPVERCFDVGKHWHAIQFLLNGDPWLGKPPLHNAVMGGAEIGEEDVGYGPARGLTAAEVKAVAAALKDISGAALWRRFDEAAFASAQIYPGGWSADAKKQALLLHYEGLRSFFTEAATAGDAMLIYLD